jgi:hypothetical protein
LTTCHASAGITSRVLRRSSRAAATHVATLPGFAAEATRNRMMSASSVRTWPSSYSSRLPTTASNGSHDVVTLVGMSAIASVNDRTTRAVSSARSR